MQSTGYFFSIFRLFEVAPQTQALFPFRDETMEELKTSKKLGRHADNFMKKVILAIEGMDVLFGEVGPKLVSLGSRHYGFGVEAPNFAVSVCFHVSLGTGH